MKYLDEFRDGDIARRIAADIGRITTRPWAIMEVCGGQTHAIIRHGIDQILPPGLELIHGPGCPVCVTPLDVIDQAIAIASRPEVTCCSFGVPIVVTGFEPVEVLEGIRCAVRQLEAGEARVENAYARVVSMAGNQTAQQMLAEVFEVTDRTWRGIGAIPASGWQLAAAYRTFDAAHRFDVTGIHTRESSLCHSGEVLQGVLTPNQCPAFGTACTPRTPLGATMVSGEGACAAYYHYGRFREAAPLS